MSEMVERVALAIFDCSGYDDAVNFHLEDWAPAARAAIAAMREPTKEMIDAGQTALDDCKDRDFDSNSGGSYEYIIIGSQTTIYQVMIYEALK